MTITERLEKYMVHKGLNPNKITNEADLSVGLIGRAINNNTTLNSETIEKILQAYPDLNAEWLLLEKGDMIKLEQKIESQSTGNCVNSNLSGVTGSVAVSQNEMANLVDTQIAHQEMERHLIESLKISQEQLSESQSQIKTLLEIIQSKL